MFDKADCSCKAPLAPQPFFAAFGQVQVIQDIAATLSSMPESIERDTLLAILAEKADEYAVKARKRHEAAVLQTFPNLITFPDKMSRRQILLEIRRSSVLSGEIMRFRNLRSKLLTAKKSIPANLSKHEYREKIAEAQDRVLYDHFAEKYGLDRLGFEESRTLMQTAISNVRNAIDDILREFFPINRRKQLEFAAEVLAAHNMPQLIDLMVRERKRGVISNRIPFEARLMAVLAQLEFENLIGTHNPDILDQIRKDLIHQLETQVFRGSESARVIVVAELDPQNKYRVKRKPDGNYAITWYYEHDPEAKKQTSETCFVLYLDVRIIKKNGTEILIYFDSRRKERIFAKQLRKPQRKPEQITDLSGIAMVLLNNSLPDEEYLANRLRETLINCPGLVSAQQSNASRAGAIDPSNPHSSPNRRGEKYEFLWQVWHELQILALPDYINSLVAHAGDGHPFYKLATYLDTLFPWIWPTHIYGLDWYDQSIRDILWSHQCRMLQSA